MENLIKILKNSAFWGVGVFAAVFVAFLFYTDPDNGGSTIGMLINFAAGGLAVTASYGFLIFVFPKISINDHCDKAKGGSISSSIVLLAIVIFLYGMSSIFSPRAHAQSVKTYIPTNAKTYCPMLQAEKDTYWPEHSQPAALCSLVEVESCITLKHSKCWSPLSQLKTSREEGAGMPQLTRAYKANGSLRFDTLTDLKNTHKSLSELSWSNVYQRPDLQLRSIVLMNRDCFIRLSKLVKNSEQVLQMCDAAYNGGYGGLQSERRACGMKPDCNAQVWFGNVERVCLKSKTKWEGYGRSACDINRDHVRDVFVTRYDKYAQFIAEL